MRFKKLPQLPGAGRTRAGHHHGSNTPTSPVLLGKMAYHTKQIRRQCKSTVKLRLQNLIEITQSPITMCTTLESRINEQVIY